MQVGLGIVDEDLIACPIVERLVLLAGHTKTGGEALVATADRLGKAGRQIIAVVEAAAGAELGFEMRRARLALFGHDIDDAPGRTASVDGAGAGQYFDPLDVERRDTVELARQASRAVLADAIDHHQHAAPTHVLPVIGAPLRRQVKARHQFADGFLEAYATVDLLAKLLLIDHPHGAWDLADGGAGTRGHAHFDRLEVDGFQGGIALAQRHRARIGELPAQAAAFEQPLQGVFDTVGALQGRALQTRHISRGVQQMQAGLIGKARQRLVQRLRRDVQLNLRGLHLPLLCRRSDMSRQRAGQHGQRAARHQYRWQKTAAAIRGLGHERHEKSFQASREWEWFAA